MPICNEKFFRDNILKLKLLEGFEVVVKGHKVTNFGEKLTSFGDLFS